MIMRPTASSFLLLSFLSACADGPGDPDRDPPGQTIGDDGSSSDSAPDSDDGSTTQPDPMDDGDETDGGGSTGESGTEDTGEEDLPCTGECVANAPSEWHGPAALQRTSAAEDEPTCVDSHPIALASFVSDLVAQPATCGCDCGVAEGMTCETAKARVYAEAACNGTLLDIFDIGLSCTNGLELVQGFWQVSFDPPDGGGCDAQPDFEVPALDFTRWTLCGAAEVDGDCDVGESCAPSAGAVFEDTLCVWHEGDLACPGSVYTERTLVYESITDDRECGECSCGAPTGICTGGQVDLNYAPNCPGPGWFNWPAEHDECFDEEFYFDSGIVIEPATPYASCEPTVPMSLGSASAEVPFTVCCEPQ